MSTDLVSGESSLSDLETTLGNRLWHLLYKGTNLIHKGSTLMTKSLPKTSPPNTWDKVSTYEFGGTQALSVAFFSQSQIDLSITPRNSMLGEYLTGR